MAASRWHRGSPSAVPSELVPVGSLLAADPVLTVSDQKVGDVALSERLLSSASENARELTALSVTDHLRGDVISRSTYGYQRRDGAAGHVHGQERRAGGPRNREGDGEAAERR
jgi:hypothetical protein